MFGNKLRSYIARLEKEKLELKSELEDLKLKKKIETEDIKHMVKMAKERNGIELEKAKTVMDRKAAEDIATVKDTYRDKTEKQLEKQLADMRGMYGEILERLPNYNIRHKVDGL